MRFKYALKKFVYETFRPHSMDEYAELFSRGHGGNEKTPYPWFYARVLLISLLLFTLICVGYSASNLNFLMVTAAGAFFADLTFIVLLVEIYPKRDLPLLTPVLALFGGGILSSSFIYVLYGIASFSQPYIDQAWTAFVEETGKALATIIIILIAKKRNPFACFIIGAAVGGGYSAFENMWFMYTYGFGWQGLSQAIETGLWRALGTPFSHAAWAGLFGWALGGQEPWRSWKPYATYAFGYTMHFFVNFPLMEQFAEWKGYPISAITGILSIAVMIFTIAKCRRSLAGNYNSYDDYNTESFGFTRLRKYHKIKINGAYSKVCTQSFDSGVEQPPILSGEVKNRFIANVFAAAAILCFSFTLLGPTCIFGGYVNYSENYYDKWEDVLPILQSGCNLIPDYNREYVEYSDLSENYSYTWTDGELTSVVQRQQYDAYYYRFTYGYVEYDVRFMEKFADEDGRLYVIIKGEIYYLDEAGNEMQTMVRVWELKNLALELNNTVYYPRVLNDYYSNSYPTYSPDAESVSYRYFLLNSSVMYLSVLPDGTFELDLRDRVPIRMVESVVFSSVFFAAFIGCGIAYIVYKKK